MPTYDIAKNLCEEMLFYHQLKAFDFKVLCIFWLQSYVCCYMKVNKPKFVFEKLFSSESFVYKDATDVNNFLVA